MKSRFVGEWRPLMGVAVVGALVLGVSALAAPRGVDEAVRGTDKSGTQVTRLVTGDPAQINAVVAGAGTTAILSVTPVLPPAAATPVNSYPTGVTIVGQELRVDRSNKDGFRAWFNVQVSDWDPLGNGPGAITYQVKIDCTGYMDSDCPGDGADLVPAVLACPAGVAICRSTFGESWAKCNGGFCDPGYLDGLGTGRPDGFCAAPEACNTSGVAIGTCNYNYFAVSDSTLGTADAGTLYYGGTLVLDLPAGAKGKYTVVLNRDETFLAAPGAPPPDIPTLQENGFTVNFVTGSCCFGLGTPAGGCTDACINRSDCEARPGPRVYTPGASCANPPTDDGCVECVTQGIDPLCNDGDSCTTETCNAAIGVCVRGNVAGWDTATECCDGSGAVAVIASKDDGNPCTDDACSGDPTPAGPPKPGNGTPTHTPSDTTTPCDDDNPCSTADTCAGPPSTACAGIDVNTIACVTDANCPLDPAGTPYTCVDGLCFCSLVPELTFVLGGFDPKHCAGGLDDGDPCSSDGDCRGGTCGDLAAGENCFVSGVDGAKVTALLHIGSAGSPINGGQFLISYDPSCLDFNSVVGVTPYTNTIYGPVVNETAGTIFIAVGVGIGAPDGPLGNTDILSLSFKKIGECNNCELRIGGNPLNNPQNTYLVDDEGQKVDVEGIDKTVNAKSVLSLDVPDNIKTNVDCDRPTAFEPWNPPTATDSCGTATLTCRGAHESGLAYPASLVLHGGALPRGASSFCCSATSDEKCGQTIGCSGATNDCSRGSDGKPVGCWTVEVNDETSLDIDVQLCPPITHNDGGGELTRCIKFCLFENCIEDPLCFSDDVTFGGLFNFIGKSAGKIKIPGAGQWDCITAQDQLHTLRSCFTFDANGGDCVNGQLHADFTGDGLDDANCLIGGNLDGWKKDVPGTSPSLDVIDILDFGTFVSQFGICYADNDTPCGTAGPNADINGDGCVTMADYQFVLNNFLVSAKDCCCGPQAADLPPALAEVSVDELRQMGQGDLAVADLNGDGLVSVDDMDAFMQGARPTKSHDRKGGKGLRSGR